MPRKKYTPEEIVAKLRLSTPFQFSPNVPK